MAESKGLVIRAGVIAGLQLLLSAGGSIAAVAVYQEKSTGSIQTKVAVLETRVNEAEKQKDEIKAEVRAAMKDLADKIDTLTKIMLTQRQGRPVGS